MATNPSVGVVNQYGAETTRGTGVTAAKKWAAASMTFSPQTQSDFFRRAGSLFPTSAVGHRSWSAGALDGRASYNELHTFLAMYRGHETVTNPEAGAYLWPTIFGASANDGFKTITGQRGSSQAAWEVNYLALASLSMSFGLDSITIGGDVVGRSIDNSATLDTVTTEIAPAQISIADLKWFIDTTSGGLGTTQWNTVMEAELSLPTNKAARFVQNGTATFDELVETAMEDGRLTIRAQNDTQSRAIMDAMYVDSRPIRYIRFNADGEIIVGSTVQRLRGNFAVALESVTEIADLQGTTYGLEFNFRIMYSTTWGRAGDMSVTNNQATL